MYKILQKDILTSYAEFEKSHNIEGTRNDIPHKFLGVCPSKYYKTVDMDIAKITGKVNKLFKKLYHRPL